MGLKEDGEEHLASRDTHKAPITSYTISLFHRRMGYPVDFLDKDMGRHLNKLRQESPRESCP